MALVLAGLLAQRDAGTPERFPVNFLTFIHR
jgi:hypothetical protein